MVSSSPTARTLAVRLVQTAATFVAFALCNALAVRFQVEDGVSILFPATAVAIVACMWFGWWAAVAVVLATIATPWRPDVALTTLLTSGAICAAEGLIPYLVFRWRRELAPDLRDMKSFVAFLVFGTIVNTGISAILGNLLVVPAFEWRGVFVWWISGFIAALLLALPALAFGGALLNRFLRHEHDQPRTITNTLQIVTVIILLGFAASFAVRTYLLNRLEEDRLEQQRAWALAEEKLNRMHANVLRAAFLDRSDANAPAHLTAARRTNEELVRDLSPLLLGASNELRREFPLVASEAAVWLVDAEPSGVHAVSRRILGLDGAVERANAAAWAEFSATRGKLMTFTAMVEAVVFVTLVLASATLLYTISRPFAQLRGAIRGMREGHPLATRIDSPFLEFRSVAETLDETARELRRREEELRHQTERAIRASQHKSDFLAKMSHELRTPLNSIIGFSDLLIEQEGTIDPAKRRNFLDNVTGSAKHLLKLINDLLDIAKVESGKIQMNFEDVDLRMTIAHSVASTQPLFVRKQQHVDVKLPDEPMLVRADAGRIEQVLLNLLSNANKFTPPGERIEVRSAPDDRMWRIEVADRGIGISADDQLRIFDEFEQVHTRGMVSNGTGLGLALAKRFVEAHGGEIAVESAPGEGSVFRVRLPRI